MSDSIQLIVNGQTVYANAAAPVVPAPTPAPVPAPTPVPVPPVVGTCPPAPSGMVRGDLGLQGATQRPQLTSGQVICFPIPTSFPAGSKLGVVRAGETTATPAKSYFEIMISKCPGEIRVTTDGSYGGTYTQNLIELYWWFKPVTDRQGAFIALDTEGPWYINSRWTYPVQTPWGYGSYVFQWQAGGA